MWVNFTQRKIMPPPIFTRRLGPRKECLITEACPDVLELSDGDFALIGLDITDASAGRLPVDAACGAGERIVRIPRSVLLSAIPDIVKG